MLGVVGSKLKMVKFFMQHLWMLLGSVAFKCCDRLAGACKCLANNVGICGAEMPRLFGRGLIAIT